jgi:hypothetical protein
MLQTGQLTQTELSRVILALVPEESRGMRYILVRRRPRVDNSNDVRGAMSTGINPPDRVEVFALLYPSLHVSSMSLVGVGEEAEEMLLPSLGKCNNSWRAVGEG